jgi:hypothetical protein
LQEIIFLSPGGGRELRGGVKEMPHSHPIHLPSREKGQFAVCCLNVYCLKVYYLRGCFMSELKDGYYFMFEIGWFLDLLIPTVVRIKDGGLYMVGSKPCDIKDLKPCCIPCGGAEESKKLAFDDPSLKAFKCLDSLVAVEDTANLEAELKKSLEREEIKERYFNTKGKLQKEATIERIMSDYQVLTQI